VAEFTEIPARWRSPEAIVPPLIAAALFVLFLQALPAISAGETLRYAWSWVPSLNLQLSFFIDGLSLTFALLITGIGVLVMLFAGRYLAGHPQQGRFSLYITAFMLSMLGLVLSDNLLSLFVFWELTTLTSYLLIGFAHHSAEARRCALQALLVTAFGGLAMLGGFLLMGLEAGTLELSEIRAMGEVMRESPLYVPILILLLLGAFTKSAQVPFHFWLPNAMAAPTPVSAYLHSATMVKGGVYLLARLHPSFSGTELWFWALLLFGGVTTVFASMVAIRQTDLKQTLAYTTLMALGALTLFLAPQGGYAITAMATFLVIHCLYKAALFLMIGCVDHATHTRDARELGGLGRHMPVTALAAGLAGLSMAGLPPLLGFIGKELLYKGALESPVAPFFVAFILTANALMFAAAGIVALKPFWGSGARMPQRHPPIHEAPWQMLAGPAILGVLGLYFGLVPYGLEGAVVVPLVGAVLGDPGLARHLHLWAGVNTALFLSLVTFALGILLYGLHGRLRNGLIHVETRLISFDRGWDTLLVRLRGGATALTGAMQSGVLNRYLFIVFATVVVGVGATMLVAGLDFGNALSFQVDVFDLAIFVLTLAGTALVVQARSRIAAIAGLSTVGIGIALVFILFGAPDVAITQLLVEMLVVVLLSVAALRLPVLSEPPPVVQRRIHALLGGLVGGLTTVTLIAVTSTPFDTRLTDFFEQASYPEAHGRNIVNVILVDFRALDTMGEITVVAVAALAAYALLKQRRGAK
jgi:multicomponent Na+:H+ antiporter subunit A